MWLFSPLDHLAAPYDFAALVAVVYAATVAIYFVVCGGLVAFGNRRPEYRIPTTKGGARRPRHTARTDILRSLQAMLVSALCTAGALYAQYRGWALTPLELTPVSAIWTFVVATVLFDFWFYVAHRIMHTKPLYKWHKAHHSNVTPSAWAMDHFTIPDALSTQSFFFVLPFVVPIPPAVYLVWRGFDQIKGAFGHSGLELFASRFTRWPFPFIAVVHHDMHHQRFQVNFANQFTVWDRLCGTLDPDYDAQVRDLARRRKRRNEDAAPASATER
jgi:sterol desaturase/sphingolipid hydroxylase (fatty acid hydroxylase superfamily)